MEPSAADQPGLTLEIDSVRRIVQRLRQRTFFGESTRRKRLEVLRRGGEPAGGDS